MPTERQKRAFKEIAENRRSVSGAMKEVGYSRNTYCKPKNLTESEGFKKLCEEYGLTDKLILTSLTEDIISKPKNRKPELELAAKIKGMLTEKHQFEGDLNINVITKVPRPSGDKI